MVFSRTVVIGCAGMGNRLGLGTTKALLDVCGKPLIIRHLEYLDDEDDIRIVVGYQAQQVIDVVNRYRRDITFVFNHNYRNTGTGASVTLASHYAGDFILSIDGDLLVHPDDMKKILNTRTEFVGGGEIESEDPWMLQTYDENGKRMVSAFSKCRGNYEWNGITQMKSAKFQNGSGHVFHLIEPYLPVEYMNLRTREIDTISDYEKANAWVSNGFEED